ncbi:MAG: hypothetical protein V7731_13385 [Amphritea sp.]
MMEKQQDQHAQQQDAARIRCAQCDCEFAADRISCPSCGMPVAKTQTQIKARFIKYFVALVVFCALVIMIAPR